MNRLRNFNNKVVLCFLLLLVVFAISLFPYAIKNASAITETGQNSTFYINPGSVNGGTYDPDPYYGTHEYWDEWWNTYHSGEEKVYLPTELAAGTTLTSGYYFISKDGVNVSQPAEGVPGILIKGKVYLLFEDGAVLNVSGGNGLDNIASAPAIEVTSGYNLYCCGNGFIKADGPSHYLTDDYVRNEMSGYPRESIPRKWNETWATKEGDRWYVGCGGYGGAGSAGIAAVIGSRGGAGGAKTEMNGLSESRKRPSIKENDRSDKSGLNGEKGNDGSMSEYAGNFYFEGNIKVDITKGSYHCNTNLLTGGLAPYKLNSYDLSWFAGFLDLCAYWQWVGCGGAGGSGNIGYEGAFIGSGGGGAGGGGSGGTGGLDYNTTRYGASNPQYYFLNVGAGGGAGGGSALAHGGESYGQKYKIDDMDTHSEYGKDFDGRKTDPSATKAFGSGGKGSTENYTGIADGANGGDGGSPGIAGYPGQIFSTTHNTASDNAYVISDYQGQESRKYIIFPEYDCKIVLKGSIDENPYTYEATGQAITPEFDVVYNPTGEVLPASAYTIEWKNNTEVGTATLIVTGMKINHNTVTLGKTMSEGRGQVTVNFEIISTGIKVDISIDDKVYDKELIDVKGTKKITNLKDEDVPETLITVADLSFTLYKIEGTTRVECDADSFLYGGDYIYKAYVNSDKGKYYHCVTEVAFSVTKKTISIIDYPGQTKYVGKQYDGTCEEGTLFNSRVDGIYPDDLSGVYIDNGIEEYTSPNVGSYNGKLHPSIFSSSQFMLDSYEISDSIDILYSIQPCIVTVTKVLVDSRRYEEDNFDINVYDVSFSLSTDVSSFSRDLQWEATATVDDNTVGKQTAEVKVKILDNNFTFSGSSMTYTTNVDVWIIGESGKVQRPNPSTTNYVYNGSEQTYDVPEINGIYSVENNKQTNANENGYDVKYTLNEGYTWDDESTEPYIIKWKIYKAEAFEIPKQSINHPVYYTHKVGYAVFNNNVELQNGDLFELPKGFDVKNSHGYSTSGEKDFLKNIGCSIDNISQHLGFYATTDTNVSPLLGDKASYRIEIQSTNYKPVNLYFDVELVEYTYQIQGLNVVSKDYDGEPVNYYGTPKFINMQTGLEASKEDSEKFNLFNFDYYNSITGEKLITAPTEPGDYYLIVTSRLSTIEVGYLSAISNPIYFSINKVGLPVPEESRYILWYSDTSRKTVNITIDHPEYDTIECDKGESTFLNGFIKPNWLIQKGDGKVIVRYELTGAPPTEESGNYALLSVVCKSKHYKDVEYRIKIEVSDNKLDVNISGLGFRDDLVYDGQEKTPEGTLKLLVNDEDVTSQIPESHIKYSYYKIIYNTETKEDEEIPVEPPIIDAGKYRLNVSISEEETIYTGSTNFDFYVAPKDFDIKINDLRVEKEFDGTTEVDSATDVVGSVDFDWETILEQDKDKVSLSYNPDEFSSINVGHDNNLFYIDYSGDRIANYNVTKDLYELIVDYNIKQKVIGIENISAVNRTYEKDNTNVDLSYNFVNFVTGFNPEVVLSQGSIDTADAGENKPVSYKISIKKEGNYCFAGDSYDVTGNDITVDVSKASAIALNNLKFEHQYDLEGLQSYPVTFDSEIPDDYYKDFSTKIVSTEGVDVFSVNEFIYSQGSGFKFNAQIDLVKSTEPNKQVIFTFDASTKNYATSRFSIIVDTTKYSKVLVSGITVEDKICDGQPATETGQLKLYDPYMKQDLDLSSFDIEKLYYVTEHPETKFESAPSNAGAYTLKISSNSKIAINNQKIYYGELSDDYTISKIEKHDFETQTICVPISYSGDHDYDLNLDIPQLMSEGLTYSKDSQSSSKVVSSWNVNNEGVVSYTLNSTLTLDDFDELIIKLTSTNYNDSFVKLIVKATNREEVDISGLSFKTDGYEYNGNGVSPDGNIIVTKKDGEDITSKFSDSDFEYLYYDTVSGQAVVGNPTNVGSYKLTVKISDSNLEYVGVQDFLGCFIYPKGIYNVESSFAVSKVFDGTLLAEKSYLSGDATSADILEKDKAAVSLVINELMPYTNLHAHTENVTNNLSISGDTFGNYQLNDVAKTVDVPYKILQREIKYDTSSVIVAESRDYDYDNLEVNITGAKFKDYILGFEPVFTAKGILTSADAGEGKEVSAKISLSESNKINDYCFEEGSSEIVVPNVTTVKIEKSKITEPIVFKGNVKHDNEFGDFSYIFKATDFPGGMIDGSQQLEVISKDDPSEIVTSINVDSSNMQVNYNLAKFESINDHALVTFMLKSNNYSDTQAQLDISLFAGFSPVVPGTNPIQTSDYLCYLVALLSVLMLLAFLILKARLRLQFNRKLKYAKHSCYRKYL